METKTPQNERCTLCGCTMHRSGGYATPKTGPAVLEEFLIRVYGGSTIVICMTVQRL
jgi:hypothetical protein